jgi:DNA-binding CsgD family transcriptional regulator
MRRLTVELSLDELDKFIKGPSLQKIRSMEVLNFLRQTPEEVALICRVEFQDPDSTFGEVFGSDWGIQILEKEKEGTYTFFLKRQREVRPPNLDLLSLDGYLSIPYQIKDGRVKITFLGNLKQINGFLKMLDRLRAKYKVVSLIDAKFSPNSPLSRLTEKQRRVMITAYQLGYYDLPRRINSDELAERLKISNPTLVMHRRKAEKRLLDDILKDIF